MLPIELDATEIKAGTANYPTNKAILGGWEGANTPPIMSVTGFRSYRYAIKRFMDAWGDHLVSTLEQRHIMAYLDQYGRLCANLKRQNRPARRSRFAVSPDQTLFGCKKGFDTSKCNGCPAYESVKPQSIEHILSALSSLYGHLADVEVIPYNFLEDVKKRWMKKNRHRFRKEQQRGLTQKEVEQIIRACRYINGKLAVLIMAKWGLRPGEAGRIKIDKHSYNPVEGYFKLPFKYDKRRGNRILVIDEQMAIFLRVYLRWREGVLQENDVEHDYLLISRTGDPYINGREKEICDSIVQPAAVRLGLMEEDSPTSERVTARSCRHFFSTYTSQRGLRGFWWHVLRGDKAHANEETYIHKTIDEIRQTYLAARPVLDIEYPVDNLEMHTWADRYLARINEAHAQEREDAKHLVTSKVSLIRAYWSNRLEGLSLVRQALLDILAWTPDTAGAWFRRSDIPMQQHISVQAYSRALKQLHQAGILRMKGTRRGTHYQLDHQNLQGFFNRELTAIGLGAVDNATPPNTNPDSVEKGDDWKEQRLSTQEILDLADRADATNQVHLTMGSSRPRKN